MKEQTAQEIIDDLEKEESEVEEIKKYRKINPDTLRRYSEMGIELCF